MEILFDNEQSQFSDVSALEVLIQKAALATLEIEAVRTDVEISVLFTDNAGIQELNRDHRGKDQATDVLSFPQYLNKEEVAGASYPVLGDIVLSLERAKEQSVEYGHSFEREVGFLTVHSMLHLLGYDHETEEERGQMRSREDAVLEHMQLTRD